MIDSERFEAALRFAAKKHEGQYRIGGAEYITHPKAVAEFLRSSGYGTDHLIAALFHDLLEDTDATESELLELSSPEVLRAVKLLTKKKGCDMAKYISDIRQNDIAFAVKGADRLHNLECAFAADEAFRRKYVIETVEWYMDFSPQIPDAVKKLAHSLKTPLSEYPFLYT